MLGAQLDIDHIHLGVSTVGGRELSADTVDAPLDHAGQSGVTLVLDALRAQVAGLPQGSSLIAVEIGVPGYISDDGTVVSSADALDWHDVALAELFNEVLAGLGVRDAHVGLSNDSHLAGLHAARLELGLDSESIVVYLGGTRHIGSGLVIGGEIFRGAFGGAGDLAHLVVDPAGPACSCGRHGCLEAYLGLEALLRAGDGPTGRRDRRARPLRSWRSRPTARRVRRERHDGESPA